MVISKCEENVYFDFTWEGIVLQDNLMNDSTSWFPESNPILGSSSCQKVVNLLVDVLGSGEIFVSLDLSLDQVITVDGGRHSNLMNNIYEDRKKEY